MKTRILYLLLIPLVGIILYTNHLVDSVTRTEPGPLQNASKPSSAAAKAQPAAETSADKPSDDPAEYGIKVEHARTENDWNGMMDETMADPRATQSLEQQGLLQELKNNPQAIEEKLRRIEEEIAVQRQRVGRYPGNEEEESRLQSLFMLKAMLTALGKQTASQEDPAAR